MIRIKKFYKSDIACHSDRPVVKETVLSEVRNSQSFSALAAETEVALLALVVVEVAALGADPVVLAHLLELLAHALESLLGLFARVKRVGLVQNAVFHFFVGLHLAY